MSLLGAFVGGLIGEVIPAKYVQLGAGALFLAVGGLILYQAVAIP